MTARPDAPELTAAERQFLDRPDAPEGWEATVERMAAAMCRHDGGQTAWPPTMPVIGGAYRSLARAALSALDPS